MAGGPFWGGGALGRHERISPSVCSPLWLRFLLLEPSAKCPERSDHQTKVERSETDPGVKPPFLKGGGFDPPLKSFFSLLLLAEIRKPPETRW